MKRNMSLVREILLAIEDNEYPRKITGYSIDEIKYHAALLISAGLLDGNVQDTISNTSNIPSIVMPQDLTWEGHEFLSSIREENVWDTVKSEFKDASVETVIKVAKQLAEGYAKKKVEQILESDPAST